MIGNVMTFMARNTCGISSADIWNKAFQYVVYIQMPWFLRAACRCLTYGHVFSPPSGGLTDPLSRSCFPRGLPAPHSTSTVSSRRSPRSLRTLRKMPPLFQTPRAPNCPDLRFSPCSVRVLHMYPAIVLRSRRPPRMSLKVSFPRSRGFVDLD